MLDAAVGVFNGFVVFQPIINGIGGNLVSVQASKISTMLHQSSIIGIVPPHTEVCESPWRALVKGGKYSKHNATFRRITIHHLYSAICINFFFFAVPYAKTARILILMSIPGQILFIYAADYIHMTVSTIGLAFVMSYLTVSLIQVNIHRQQPYLCQSINVLVEIQPYKLFLIIDLFSIVHRSSHDPHNVEMENRPG